jgi:hypothetical protein
LDNNLIRLTTQLATLVLLVVCFAQQRIRAQESEGKAAIAAGRSEPDEVRSVVHTTSWGMLGGQTARISVVNANEPSEQGQQRIVFIRVLLLDAGGAVIAQSDEVAIPPGKFRSVDFNRDAISLAGEPGSGRLQTRAQIRYRPFSLVDRTQLIVWPTSIELIDNITGGTTAVWATTGVFEVVPPRWASVDFSHGASELPCCHFKTLPASCLYKKRQLPAPLAGPEKPSKESL